MITGEHLSLFLGIKSPKSSCIYLPIYSSPTQLREQKKTRSLDKWEETCWTAQSFLVIPFFPKM